MPLPLAGGGSGPRRLVRWSAPPASPCQVSLSARSCPRIPVPRRPFAVLVCVQAASLAVVVRAIPTQATCPECAFGTWGCPRRACSASDQLQALSTNFTYAAGGCWSEVPANSRTLNIDIDIWCSIDETARTRLTCDTMHSFYFDGIAILEGCMPKTTVADQLVRETCAWVCTGGRPIARCSWEFDRQGYYTAIGGGLETCWLKSVCRGGYVEVDAACKPSALWNQANNTAAELQRARAELEAVRRTHGLAQAELLGVLGTNSATPEQVKAAWAHKNATEEALAEVVQRLGDALGSVGVTLNSTTSRSDAGFLRQQVSQQLGALTSELEAALASVATSSAAYLATKQELDKVKQSFTNVNQSLESTRKEVSVLNESRKQLLSDLQTSQSQLDRANAEREADRKAIDRERTVFLAITIVVVTVLVLIIAGTACICFRYQQQWKTAVATAQLGGPAVVSNGGLMVVGRPVEVPGAVPACGKGAGNGADSELRRAAGGPDSGRGVEHCPQPSKGTRPSPMQAW